MSGEDPVPVTRGPVSRGREALAVVALLAAYFALTLSSKVGTCNTFDEIAHLTNGASFWVTGDYRLAPESVLLQRWQSLPAVVGGAAFPRLDQQTWWASDNWGLSFEYFYDAGNDPDRLLFMGRFMTALVGVALGLAVYLWSRHYFGVPGGLVSLTAYAFCPSFLAHGGLITTDVGITFFFVLSITALWAVLHRLTAWTTLASTLAMGGLFVAKMSAVLIIPMGLVLLALRIIGGRPWSVRLGAREWLVQGRAAQALLAGALIGVHVLVAAAVIWALFGFQYDMFRDHVPGRDHIYTGTWDEVLERCGGTAPIVRWARDRRLLPEAYLYSYASSIGNAGARLAFLNGEVGIYGWRSFFPYCFLVKTPLPTLLLLLLAGFLWMRGWWPGEPETRSRRLAESLYRSAPLWVLVAVYGAFAVTSRINIGHRHLLPIYPAVFAWLGATGAALAALRRPEPGVPGGRLALVAMLWLAGETLYRWPHYLAFFNPIAGGPANGYKHLVDSSLDWGQDLPGLAKWLDRHEVNSPETAHLAYFGTGVPKHYDVHAKLLPGVGYFDIKGLQYLQTWKPGVYAISATMLQAVYVYPHGRWTAKAEEGYQALREQARVYTATRNDPVARKKLHEAHPPQQWQSVLIAFDKHRLNRLCAYLRGRRSEAHVGYSILIYRLSAADLHEALDGPPPE